MESDREHRTASVATLGDVLYADKTQAIVPEEDWAALVRAIAARDLDALHALYRRTYRVVFTLTMRLTQDRATAEECTLDVFHDVWRRASSYDPANGSVLGWVMNQARSRAIDRLRFEQRKKRVDPSPTQPLPAATGMNPQETLERRQQSALLREALAVLSSAERQAIETAFFVDLTYAEAAARLGEPVGTVKTRIRSGLQKLRKALSDGAHS